MHLNCFLPIIALRVLFDRRCNIISPLVTVCLLFHCFLLAWWACRCSLCMCCCRLYTMLRRSTLKRKGHISLRFDGDDDDDFDDDDDDDDSNQYFDSPIYQLNRSIDWISYVYICYGLWPHKTPFKIIIPRTYNSWWWWKILLDFRNENHVPYGIFLWL